ncbi:MAG TPA: hypothetical protein VFH89_07900 [Sphingomicrobium sp.]|nr:hypothetical protein [Sphingomicrobium sp.]
MRWFYAFMLAFAAPAPAAQLLFAGGQWVALDRGGNCEAATRALRIAQKGKVQARAGFAFDSGGPRHGQFYAQLSRMPRAGSTVILTVGDQPFLLAAGSGWAWSRDSVQEAAIMEAARSAGGMRVESRDQAGGRFTDRYLLDGAATAIDSAAARCGSANLSKSGRNP